MAVTTKTGRKRKDLLRVCQLLASPLRAMSVCLCGIRSGVSSRGMQALLCSTAFVLNWSGTGWHHSIHLFSPPSCSSSRFLSELNSWWNVSTAVKTSLFNDFNVFFVTFSSIQRQAASFLTSGVGNDPTQIKSLFDLFDQIKSLSSLVSVFTVSAAVSSFSLFVQEVLLDLSETINHTTTCSGRNWIHRVFRQQVVDLQCRASSHCLSPLCLTGTGTVSASSHEQLWLIISHRWLTCLTAGLPTVRAACVTYRECLQ